MTRVLIAACAAATAVALSFAAPAGAADGDQVVRVQDGQIRCLISTDDIPRGGGPMATCQKTDGTPFGTSPDISYYTQKPSLAVVHGTGEMFWFEGFLPPPENDIVIAPGQTYHVNGWTIRDDDLRAFIRNDESTHGMTINVTEARQI